ncbi:MAG: exo-alpha-sialidase [Acidimicrobiia bacterium]|nr:exo-alpha-sialidase [Acidimicrobiia bacterium]
MLTLRRIPMLVAVLVGLTILCHRATSAPVSRPVVKVKVVPSQEPSALRQTIIGPGKNQPDPFPGYGGFVGWESPVRLKNGTWLVGFNAGYWHGSPPTPLRVAAKDLHDWTRMGFPPNFDAPTGGRAMLVRSTDNGKTWSKPETMIDTGADDRHASILELSDGTLLCSYFSSWGMTDIEKDPAFAHHVRTIRSFDGGKTWEQTPRGLPPVFAGEEADGPMVLRKDGSVLLTVGGVPKGGGPTQSGVFSSKDRGESWQLLSVVKADHNLDEPHATELADGRLVMIARPEGDICWSSDRGKTWTEPVTFGMRMFAPTLFVLRDGTLVCLHGSYTAGAGGLRVTFSRDGGLTWIAPATNHGFLIDRSYGYGKAMELPDGSIFVCYLSTGGHRTDDARTNAIWAIRFRIKKDYSGIELLPAPGRLE